MKNLKNKQPELDLEENDIKYITTAGLCSNLGHGPFSIVFSDFAQENLGYKNWNKFENCVNIFEYLIENNKIDLFDTSEIKFIKDLIIGKPNLCLASKKLNFDINKTSCLFESNPCEKINLNNIISNPITKNIYKNREWMFHIVNNQVNGVDMIKFDYLSRDAYKIGVPQQSFDPSILMNKVKVIKNKLCYRVTDSYLFYDLYYCRYRLYKEFYLHRVTKGIELMIKDIFKEANEYYNFKDYVESPKLFVKLNDSILDEILFSSSSKLEKAKDLVKRIYERDLYKFVAEITINSNNLAYEKLNNITKEDILSCTCSKELQLNYDDFAITKTSLDFCKGEEDPVKYVDFYEGDSIKNVNISEISLMIPSCFKEIIVRIYVTNIEKFNTCKQAFFKFCKEKAGENPNLYEKKANTGKSSSKIKTNVTYDISKIIK